MQRAGKMSPAVVTVMIVAIAGIVISLAVLNRRSSDELQNGQNQDGQSTNAGANGPEHGNVADNDRASGSGKTTDDEDNNPAEGNADAGKFSAEDASVVIEAVAAAEDAEFDRALKLWRTLVGKFPENASLRINEAVTVLKWIDETHNLLSSGQIQDSASAEQVQQELEDAFDKADVTIEGLAALENADGRAALLQAALLEAKARDADLSEADALRLKATEILANALRANPAQPILACKFDELVETLGNQELRPLRTDVLFESWKTLPRNLLLLNRAISTCAEQQDPRLAQLLLPSMEYTKPLWSVVQRDVARIKPEEMLPAVKEAVEGGDWDNLLIRRDLRRWTNVIRGMKPAFTSDGRIVKPDIMALLDTSVLNQVAREVPTDLSPLDDAIEFQTTQLSTPATSVQWFDFDIDLDVDLLSAEELTESSSRVSLWINDDGFSEQARKSVEVDVKIEGMLIAEFFASDEPSRPMLPSSVEELMQTSDSPPSSPASSAVNDTQTNPGEAGEEDLSADAIAAANRHNTLQEVVCWGSQGIRFIVLEANEDGSLELTALSQPTGLEAVANILTCNVLDIESDGDLDLVVATTEGIRVFQNNGNRTFQEVTQFSELSEAPQVQHLTSVDFDGDLDQDLIGVSADSERVVWLENLRHGQFRSRLLDGESWPTLDFASAIAFAEIDGNSSWDLVAADQNQITVAMTRTVSPGEIVPQSVLHLPHSANVIGMGDWNNDGFIDMAIGTEAGIQIRLGQVVAGWSDPQSIDAVAGDVSDLVVADANNDGALDIACISEGQLSVLMGTPNANGYLAARVRGINDETKGGRINHFGIGTTLELWHTGRQQRAVVNSPVTHFGLGKGSAENLRVIFPNGLTQNRESPPVNSLVEEIQELKGSCPFVYGWNGEEFELITDLLWAAPLGLQVARGQVVPDRRWEYLALPGELMREKDGFYELRVTEELWEIAYFDHLQLTAVDHPIESRLFTNEKVGPPQIAQPQLFVSSNPILPIHAIDSKGRDVLDDLRTRDEVYAQAFDEFICQGLVEPHFIELDFGDQLANHLSQGKDCRLFLTGWMHPTDTSLNIGISQNERRSSPEPPSLWVLDENDHWQCVRPVMGFPGGKPKSIVIDLNNIFLSDQHRVRIASSQQIYWDEAFVDFDTNNPRIEPLPLRLESAELHFRGFSKLLPRSVHQPHWYDYHQVSKQPKWPDLSGPFTRFGDVSHLIAKDDDCMVVMTSGDEMAIRFAIPDEPVPAGMRRDFVLHSTGWDKDADLNTLAGQGSLPLPFKSQVGYPTVEEQQDYYDQIWLKNREFQTRQNQDFADGVDGSTLQ